MEYVENLPVREAYLISAADVINFFIEDMLLEYFDNDWFNNGETFIVPDQEQPEDVDNPNGYIVYSTIKQPGDDAYFYRSEQILYTMHHRSSGAITAAINLIEDRLDRWDDSARYLEDWMRREEKDTSSRFRRLPVEYRDAFKKFYFRKIRVIASSGRRPATDEGGRQEAMFTVHVEYTHEYRSNANGFAFDT